ncbi:hypothetical protein, partial, partial [Parasitella parasitica]
ENRLKWCSGKANWGYDKWKYFVWSDESKFNIVGNDGGARVLRKEGERYDNNHVIKTTKFETNSNDDTNWADISQQTSCNCWERGHGKH